MQHKPISIFHNFSPWIMDCYQILSSFLIHNIQHGVGITNVLHSTDIGEAQLSWYFPDGTLTRDENSLVVELFEHF